MVLQRKSPKWRRRAAMVSTVLGGLAGLGLLLRRGTGRGLSSLRSPSLKYRIKGGGKMTKVGEKLKAFHRRNRMFRMRFEGLKPGPRPL